jgi:tRNA nucleotidyltransferase/poly(A) polymerase
MLTLSPAAHQAHRHPALLAVSQAIQALGCHDAWWVGGLVRDLVRQPHAPLPLDWDVALPHSNVAELAPALAEQLGARCVVLDADWGIYRLVLPQGWQGVAGRPTLDCVAVAAPSMHDDLWRRDLSLNAVAVQVHTLALLDPTGGLADLAQGQLRLLSETNVVDDPLRVLRVYRFLAQLPGSTCTPDTRALCQRHGHRLSQVAPERITQELTKLLSPLPGQGQVPLAVNAMADDGLLEHLLPELTACRQVPANSHHHLPLWQHNLELLATLETAWPNLPTDTHEAMQQHLTGSAPTLAWVRLACLLHDVGKPATWQVDDTTGRHRFYGHEREGEVLTRHRLTALRFAKQSTEAVALGTFTPVLFHQTIA